MPSLLSSHNKNGCLSYTIVKGGQDSRNCCTRCSTSNMGRCMATGTLRLSVRILLLRLRRVRSYSQNSDAQPERPCRHAPSHVRCGATCAAIPRILPSFYDGIGEASVFVVRG